jgi:DNA-binding NarL/FixJ family response regulator
MDDSTQVPAPSSAPARVLVVDDHDLVAESLVRALGAEPDLLVVGQADSVKSAVSAAERLGPDIVVLDYGLPDGTGADAARAMRDQHVDIEIVMLTGMSSGATLAAALEAGCSGFVTKESSFSELIHTIRAVRAGEVRVPPELMADLAAHLRPRARDVGADLTAREREVLQLLAEGCSTDEMVRRLFLSVHTVRNHIRNVLTKLHARSRLEAVAIAIRVGILGQGAGSDPTT